ncbi:MAG TPA: IclR family transcriptional regulator [Aliiroseovarius sp.]|nr:IclR family transcriptional regulator [Aliiroseovarius sp.]
MPQEKRLRGRPKAFTDKGEARIQSLERALDVLSYVSEAGGQTLSEIAGALGTSPATTYRILSTFAARGHLEMDAGSQTWHVGPAAFRTGNAFLHRTGMVERARPLMRALMAETGETANLGVESGGQVLFLSQVETHEAIRAFFPPGTLSPMYASGIGKALLAAKDLPEIDRYISRTPLERFTEKTICARDALRDELARIHAQGYAFDDEEKSPGMRCVAAPVFNAFGEVVAGISVSGPTARLDMDEITRICSLVRQRAGELSHALGYAPAG